MKIQIGQWSGVKGLQIKFSKYSIGLFCSLLSRWRLKDSYNIKWKEQIFSIKKNRRTGLISIWDYDITLFGLTLQIQEYQNFMLKSIQLTKDKYI